MAAQITAWHVKNPEKRRQYAYKCLFGITIQEYDAILAAQGGHCCFCNRQPKSGGRRFPVDHDHSKKKGEPGFIREIGRAHV
jgi:hypothetical protein